MTLCPIEFRTRLVALGTVAWMTLAAGLPRPLAGDHTALKCGPTPERKEPHLVLDGRFVDRASEEVDLEELEIHSVSIVCWDPVRRTFVKGGGEGVIHIITRPFHDSIQADLVRVLKAQDAFSQAHGHFGADLAELGVHHFTKGVEIRLESTYSGWIATARGDLLLKTCHIFVGEIDLELDLQEPRTVECVHSHSGSSASRMMGSSARSAARCPRNA